MKQQVNLYLAQYPPAKKIKIPFKYVLLMTVIVGGSVAGGALAYQQIEAKKKLLVAEKKLMNVAQNNVTKLIKLKNNSSGDRLKLELIALQSTLKRKKVITDAIVEQTNFISSGFSERYIALARQDVKGLWLNSIAFDVDEQRVTLKGATTSAALLTDYLEKLSKETAFSGVSLRILKMNEMAKDQSRNKKFLEFVVSTHQLASEESNELDLLRTSLRK